MTTATLTEEGSATETVKARLGFVMPSDVVADDERKGLLRAKTPPPYSDSAERVAFHQCSAIDWSLPTSPRPSLKTMGFDCIDLAGLQALQETLEQVRRQGQLSAADARAIRAKLKGRTLPLTGGGSAKILFIASEGLITRKSGPNGLNIDPDEQMSAMNGHRAASMVHGDQDVYGTPLRQMMKGMAPWLFRHQTPDGANRWSPIFLLNIWIPLQQITQPLALMDRRTLDPQKHQLRFAMPTDAFLERDKDTRDNDLWLFLHDQAQQWYFHSELSADRAYAFDTLGEAHGALTLPGEDVAEHYYLSLRQACEAISRNDSQALKTAIDIELPSLPGDTTRALRKAVEDMRLLLEQARNAQSEHLAATDWCERAQAAMDRVVRKSIEMRAVAWVR